MRGAYQTGNIDVACTLEQELAKRLPTIPLYNLCDDRYHSKALMAGNAEFLVLHSIWRSTDPLPYSLEIDPRCCAQSGRIEMIQWASKCHPELVKPILEALLRKGHLEAVNFVHHELGVHVETEMECALESGNLELVRHLHIDNGLQLVCDCFPRYTVEVMEYLLDHGVGTEFTGVEINLRPDHRWIPLIYRMGIPINSDFVEMVVVNGNIEDLDKVKAHSSITSSRLVNLAIEHDRQIKLAISNNHPEMFRYLVKETKQSISKDIYAMALEHTTDVMLRALHDVECPDRFQRKCKNNWYIKAITVIPLP
eukprot:gene14386-16975_t